MALIRVTTPTPLAVTLEDARSHLLIDDQTDRDLDDKIRRALDTALDYCALQTSRAIAVASYELRLPCWPYICPIEIPIAPVREVVSAKYRDADGNEQTIDPADYRIEITDRTSWFYLRSGYSQPALSSAYRWPIVITVSAGFDPPDYDYVTESERDLYKLPPQLKNAVLLMTEAIFEVGAITDESMKALNGVANLLIDQTRIIRS